MAVIISPDVIEPLLEIAELNEDSQVRIAAMDAASRFPLSEEAWHCYANVLRGAIKDEPVGSSLRRAALELAVRIPLMSVRHRLRSMAFDTDESDRDALLPALEKAGDPVCILPVLKRAAAGDYEAFQLLAAMPLEDANIEPKTIPPLPQDVSNNTLMWRALTLARLGDYTALDDILEARVPEPELFLGNPWTAYDAIAKIQPIPTSMHDYLIDALKRLDKSYQVRVVQLIVWAATGIADAEGVTFTDTKPAAYAKTVTTTLPFSEAQVADAIAIADKLPQRVFDHMVSYDEDSVLTALPPDQIGTLVQAIVVEGNQRAQTLEPEAPAEILIGNTIIGVAETLPESENWPVTELTIGLLNPGRMALDEGQLSWMIARASSERVIKAFADLLTADRPTAERERLLRLLGSVADHLSGRGGSPFRGSGSDSDTASSGRMMLIDDASYASAISTDDYDEPDEEEDKEERKVQVKILCNDEPRNTFVSGADNIIRCRIGLQVEPEPYIATANKTIPLIKIPPEGLKLSVELCWSGKGYISSLVLPANRTARTAYCDLHIQVPENERLVSVLVMFRFGVELLRSCK